MNRLLVTRMISVLAAILFLCCAAWCQDITGSGTEEKRTSFSVTFQTTPAIPETGIAADLPSSRDIRTPRATKHETTSRKADPTPLWKQLDNLSSSDKGNALIRLEGPSDPAPALLREFAAIEALWNSGRHGDAIERLSCLEKSYGSGLAAGISWIEPKAISGLDFSGDVQIGSRDKVRKTDLDFDEETGNLFAPVLIGDLLDDTRWTMNTSCDGGSTWLETYAWITSMGQVWDISASVVNYYCFVSYVPTTDASQSHSDARIRRFFTSDGTVDTGYNFQSVFDLGENVRQVDLVTNADTNDNRVYYLAILEDHQLVFYWTDQSGSNWNEEATGISNADYGLDAAFNEGYAERFLAVTFEDTSNKVQVGLMNPSGGWLYHTVETGSLPAVAAYNDHFFVAFKQESGADRVIKYHISYDGGGTWYWGYVADTGDNYSPDVTARRGGGISVTWIEEAGGFDPCWYRSRPYSSANWTTPVMFNESNAYYTRPMSIEWVPSPDHNYAISWIGNNPFSRSAMFDRTDWNGPPPFILNIDPGYLIPNAYNTFTVSSGDPNTRTFLAYSLTGLGSTYVPQLDVILDLGNPAPIGGPITTDGSGNGSWSLFVPPQAAVMDIWLQALQYRKKTNVVETTVM